MYNIDATAKIGMTIIKKKGEGGKFWGCKEKVRK